jgi:SAM-dependent methyltransferase
MVESPNTSKVDKAPDIGSAYRLAANGREEAEDDRLSLLERLLDPISRRRRDKVRPGWRCLEVGAGRGSMAVWLAEQVGESGKVVATDIDVTYLKRISLPNLEVHRHNILEDSLDLLGPGSFDLVCSRLTLFWLAGKQESAIQRMAECLRPGGWLVDEDGDWGTLAPVDPTHPRRLPRRVPEWRMVDITGVRSCLWTQVTGAL